jgi:serine/threonine protein kinase/Tol biopolymer transport system component
LIGTTLSHFRITAKLGEGGMGEVYRAEDLELKREVALKFLPAAMAHDPQRLERFKREAEAVAALNHPNIVTLFSIETAETIAVEPDGPPAGDGVDDATTAAHTVHFLVMELVEGKSLDEAMPPGGWSLTKVLDVGVPIAEALATAHEKGIVHRDLKPANVMLTDDGRIKVLDFGLAKLAVEGIEIPTDAAATQVATLTEAGLVLGTAPYMSPEQAQGQTVDARTDIFSLGSMLYEAATGVRAFHGDSTIDTLHKVVHGEPEPLAQRLPDAPLQLQWILRKALAKAPEDRYQSARDLVVDLKALRRDLQSDSQLPTLTSGKVPAVTQPAKKRSTAVWATIAVATLAGVAALFWTLGRQTTTPAPPPTVAAGITKQPITSSGLVTSAAISPDGKYVVYVESLQGLQSLNLRQVGGGQSLELIEARPVAYWGVTFSPDSTTIYYGVKSDKDPTGAMYQISTLGGNSRKLVTRLDSHPTFAPGGGRMAWLVANFPTTEQSAIMVANADGSDSRVLATFDFPDVVSPIFHAGPSWSPDGTLIATSVVTATGQRRARLVAVDAETGTMEWVASDEWGWSAMAGWLPTGDALLLIAESVESDDAQVWLVPYPEGAVRAITSDPFDYRIISLTADGESLLTIPSNARSDMWSMALDGSERPRKISRGRLDGVFGFDFTPDGRIVFQTLEAGRLDLAVMNADGSDKQRLTDDEEGDRYPRVAPDGRIVVRTSTASGFRLRRLDADGSNPQFIVEGLQWGKPTITPDGEWLVYQALTAGVPKIWRIPLDGGEPELVIDRDSSLPVVSPDNTRIAFYFTDPEENLFKIGVASFPDGELQFERRAEPPYGGTMLRWMPNGKSLLFNTAPGDRANLYRLPLDGGEPERLTDFADRRMYWFELAPDGKTLIVARGELSRDAVLIENFR